MKKEPNPADLEDIRNPFTGPTHYERAASLEKITASRRFSDQSSSVGCSICSNCMRCHQRKGQVLLQSVAGTMYNADGTAYTGGGFIEIGQGNGKWGEPDPLKKLTDFVSMYKIPLDKNGNFYTTAVPELDYKTQAYQARVLDLEGNVISAMAPKKVGACNTCHNGSFKLSLPSN